jgi:hypothetical protein
MKKIAGILLFAVSSVAFAHSCPKVMKEIDAQLTSAQGVSEEDMKKIKELRAEGEKLHKEGKHAESMKALEDAKKMLET